MSEALGKIRAALTRTIQITARDGDLMPDNPHTKAGALAVVKSAAPSLTDDEAVAVRDYLVGRQVDMSPEAFATVIGAVLGPDVAVVLPAYCDKIEATIAVKP